ncbi:MAG: wyosine base formation [Ilumatobacteraceae bacterium]|nr:wyosine base formation [Ilumatobacteraceae bacterium]
MNIDALCDDLLAERAELFGYVDLVGDDWQVATPADGWTVHDQLTHLAWFDGAATQAIIDPVAFCADRDRMRSEVEYFVDSVRADNTARSTSEVRDWLSSTGPALVAAARVADPTVRVPWYGPDMTVASSVTARIMETWAHGQDIVDTVGAQRAPSPRLRHVAFLGWRALPFSFAAHDRHVPTEPVRVEVDDLVFGPAEATNVVRGTALDFCLLVTQRRHLADTDLRAEGPVAAEWLTIAQAFAGPPGSGRRPGQFR